MKTTILFLIINFGALAIGGLMMDSGPSSEWYQNLNIAPWTPPGWVFGFAWSTIMLCFSFFMYYAYFAIENKRKLILLYIIQLILNISWNPVFFYFHNTLLGLFIIGLLTLVTLLLFLISYSSIKFKALLISPYILWLIIATSLNAYIYIEN